ncbi:MAG: dihydrolipoyl dehydrogenase [Comamonas sp.]
MAKQAKTFDVIVIGGGPGGYVAALRCAQLGQRVALVEREHLGGICLNWGCIPTKALLHAADTLRRIAHAGALGIEVAQPQVDFAKLVARSRQVAQRLGGGVAHLLKQAKVPVFMGAARLEPLADGMRQLRVIAADGGNQVLQAKDVILATGARARELPGLPFDGERVWSYRDALVAKAAPRSLLVIGAGAIGMEFASFYAALGTQVTVVEAQSQLLPSSDADVAAFVRQAVAKDGIHVHTGAAVSGAQLVQDGVAVQLQTAQGEAGVQAERVLVAIGLIGNTEGLGLEGTRVQVERGQIAVDGWGATAEPGIHAVGDVTGAPMLAHRASHQGLLCAERIADLHAGEAPPVLTVPACVYSHPPSASVGLTEAQARATGRALKVGSFPLEANGKAIAIDEASGFAKTIFDAQTGELLGAHLVGAEATELIHGFTLARTLEATEAELIETIFPHPTLSEAMHESVLAAWGRPLHI